MLKVDASYQLKQNSCATVPLRCDLSLFQYNKTGFYPRVWFTKKFASVLFTSTEVWVGGLVIKKNPFTWKEYVDYLRSCWPNTCCGWIIFTSTLPNLWSGVCSVHYIILWILMNNCLPEQLLPSNWITNEENSCYPNSLLPNNLSTSTIFSLILQGFTIGKCEKYSRGRLTQVTYLYLSSSR